MKIESLPSGSFRVRKMYKGKTYSVVLPYKPTQKEAIQLLSEVLGEEQEDKKPLTFKKAVAEYIETKDMLSPATLRAYEAYAKNMPEWFLKMRLSEIEAKDIQKVVAWYCKNKSVKYARNINGLIGAVLALFRPTFAYKVQFPNVSEKDASTDDYVPTAEDIKAILKEAENTPFEVPILLCALAGLRRGELYALEESDLNGNWLTINKDVVLDTKGKRVAKTPKTKASVRQIYLPDYVVERIQQQGFVKLKDLCGVYKWLQRAQKRLGIPQFSLHKLRHYYCSTLSANGVPEADILKLGGWSTPNIMKSVYRHASIDRDLEANKTAQMNVWNTTLK